MEQTQTGMSSYRSPYISFQLHLHGTGLKMNPDRSDFISVADPKIYLKFQLLTFGGHCRPPYSACRSSLVENYFLAEFATKS